MKFEFILTGLLGEALTFLIPWRSSSASLIGFDGGGVKGAVVVVAGGGGGGVVCGTRWDEAHPAIPAKRQAKARDATMVRMGLLVMYLG